MKNYVKYTMLALTVGVTLSGCIRDEIKECPGLSVVLTVKDRAYSNSHLSGYEDPYANTTEFKEVVPTIYCALRDYDTGEIVREMPVSRVEGSDDTHSVTFDSALPYGKYIVTVWGGAEDNDEVGDDPTFFNLSDLSHELFLTNDTIDYSYKNEVLYGELERVNGIVLVETHWETFPAGIDSSEKSFSALRSNINNNFEYSDVQEMLIHHSWNTSKDVRSQTILPPSVKEDGTTLNIRYFSSDNPAYKGLQPEPIKLTVRRNQVTRVRISFDPYSQTINSYVMVDGRWQSAHEMVVD